MLRLLQQAIRSYDQAYDQQLDGLQNEREHLALLEFHIILLQHFVHDLAPYHNPVQSQRCRHLTSRNQHHQQNQNDGYAELAHL
ncbi:hypothetical protein D3C81_605080 [compost metagenome]